jgi:ubiquitin carboxyl-terminal hydrolase L5
MEKEMSILDMPVRNLIGAWEACVRAAMPAKIAVEDEIAKSIREHVSSFSSIRVYRN